MATLNDLVLVNVDNKPAFYARIEDINPDSKPGWWQVRLLVLTLPLQLFTWILDEHQLEGADFTMGGTPIRMDPVVSPPDTDNPAHEDHTTQTETARQNGASSKVVSLADRRKK